MRKTSLNTGHYDFNELTEDIFNFFVYSIKMVVKILRFADKPLLHSLPSLLHQKIQ